VNGERIGWIFSGALHLGVIVAVVLGLPSFSFHKDEPTPPPVIDIEFVRIADQTTVEAPEPEPVQPDPEPTRAAREEFVPEAAAEAVPLPTPKPTPPKKREPAPKKKPELSARQKLANKVKIRRNPKAPRRFKNLSSVIDKAIKNETAPTPEPKKPVEKKVEKKPDFLAGIKRGRIGAASLRDALSQKLAGCWNFPVGAKGVEDLSVTILISLRRDGSLSRSPQYVDIGSFDRNITLRTFAESAKRAVLRCGPYEAEATKLYELGEDSVEFTFSGKEFSGG
jgi:hypothetical protein